MIEFSNLKEQIKVMRKKKKKKTLIGIAPMMPTLYSAKERAEIRAKEKAVLSK